MDAGMKSTTDAQTPPMALMILGTDAFDKVSQPTLCSRDVGYAEMIEVHEAFCDPLSGDQLRHRADPGRHQSIIV